MNDYDACAALCEDRGFARQAAFLRAVARRGLRVYAVCERISDSEGYFDESGGVPVALFLDREEAEREARRRELLAFRERNLYQYCDEGDIQWRTSLSPKAFERQVSAILGVAFKLPDPDTHSGPLFPADATDEQIGAIARIFEDIHFYYVAGLELFDGANPTTSLEPPS